jgi:hypothetical protein
MRNVLETQLRMFADPMAIVVKTERKAGWSEARLQKEHTTAVKKAITDRRLELVEWREQDELKAIESRKWKDPEWAEVGNWAYGQGARNKEQALDAHAVRFAKMREVEGTLRDPTYYSDKSPAKARAGFPKVGYAKDTAAAGAKIAAKYDDGYVTFEEVPDHGGSNDLH